MTTGMTAAPAPKPLSLKEKQSLFARLFSEFILWASAQEDPELGAYVVTFAEVWRSDGRGHKPNSLHYDRLAGDLNFYLGGRYMDGLAMVPGKLGAWQAARWEFVGKKWESMHPLCRWGGRFNDSNHFSITDGGRQ